MGNVSKHSGKCRQTFREILPDIPGDVLKHSRECLQSFRGISSNIPGKISKNSRECPQTLVFLTNDAVKRFAVKVHGRVPKLGTKFH